ncbi:DUF11 domain-containing protein [Streptomyces sp. NBC_00237]|uniref:DUF5979 domain-containing protein n=1 Tax=Streptomyces sp. NBC_00237 TaxID=2975687 RepID=UPI002256FA56|nr:DUF5979 domain-containing protein [Streptomyces sp. NBC_00237]MCX5203473.1 DUF11 domain-containing protein [Streptomyces sp. NBC_00237]
MRERIIRSGVATAVLLSSVAGTLAASPASASARLADAEVGITKRVTGAAMPIEPGGVFSYTLTASCSSLTTACVNPVVEDVLPADFDITSLPKSTDTRTVTYDQATRKLTIHFAEPLASPPAPPGSAGLPAGVSREVSIGMRVPAETTLTDGSKIPNTATINADNAGPESSSADVTVRIPRVVRPATTKNWSFSSTVAQSGENSTITLGVRNGSSTSADVTALTVGDTTAATYENFNVTGVGPVSRFPAGADRVRVLVCTKPTKTPCGPGEFVAGPIGPGPGVTLPPGVSPDRITGVQFEFTAASGAKLPYDPTGGQVAIDVVLRDKLRETGAPIDPPTRQEVRNCASVSAKDATVGTVAGPEACASHDILPNIATVQGTKEYFSDTSGDYRENGTALIGTKPPVSMVVGARNTASFPVATLTITEPSDSAASEFDKFDASKMAVEFPQGATSATLTVVCRDGSKPAPVQLSPAPGRQDLPNTGCPPGNPPKQVSVTFRGTDAKGSGTIASNALGRLSLHGTLNDKAVAQDAVDGISNCADVSATNPVDGSGSGSGTACKSLLPENPRNDIRTSKTADKTEVPPDTPVTFTLDLANAGTIAMDRPAITDPGDPKAAGNPFDVVRLTELKLRYREPSGLPVLLEVYDPTTSAWVAYNAADTALLTRAKGVRARLADGSLPPNGRIIVDVVVQRRDGVAEDVSFTNCARITSNGRPIGSDPCTREPNVTKPARSGGSVQKTISPSVVARTLPGVPRQEPDVRIEALNTGNVNLKELVVTDADADFFDAADFVRITGVTFPPGANQVRVDACTDGCTANPPVYVNGTTGTSTTPGLPAGVDAADVRGLRFTFSNSSGGYVLTPGAPDRRGACPNIVCFKVAARQNLRSDPATPIPETLSDTASAAGESPLQQPGQKFPFGDSTATLKVQEGRGKLAVAKGPDSRIGPGESAPFTLTVRNTGTGPVGSLVMADPIPELLRFDETYAGTGGLPFRMTFKVPAGTPEPPQPVFEPTRGPDGRITHVRWRFPDWSMLPGAEVKITFQVKLAPGVPGDSVIQNVFGAGSETDKDLECQKDTPRDGESVDDTKNFGPGRYCTSRAEITTLPGTAFEASKWVSGNDALGFYNSVTKSYVDLGSPACPVLKQGGRTYTQYPCIALVQPGENFDYLLRAVNSGTDATTEVRLLDVFPYLGDTGVLLGNQARGTEWSPRPRLTGAPELVGPGTLATKYATVANPCSDLIATPRRDCAKGDWKPGHTKEATGVEMRVTFDKTLPPGGEIFVRMPMSSPVDLDKPGDPSVAWNSFAHSETVIQNGRKTDLPTTEPPKVGIGMRFGNLRIDKIEINPPEGVDVGSYKAGYRCTVTPTGGEPQVVREGVFEFTPYSPMALIGVPAGARCEVWEINTRGAATPARFGGPGPQVVIITPASPNERGEHIEITNTFVDASLKVRKKTTGAAAKDYGKGPFTVTVDCRFRNQQLAGFPQDLTFHGDGETGIDGLPTGARCTATEPGRGGAHTVEVTTTGSADKDAAVIGSVTGETAGLTVTNDFPTGSLKVVKQVTGAGAAFANRTFRFRVLCSFNGKKDAVVRMVTSRKPTLTGQVDDIPVGAECMVEEVDTAGADETPKPVGPVTITKSGPTPTVAVDFTNTFSLGHLTLRKEIEGAPADAPYAKSYEFYVTCIRESETSDGDPIVAFVVRKRFTVKAGETLKIPGDLPIGARCWAEELNDGGATHADVDHSSHGSAVVVTKDAPEVTITAKNTYETGVLLLAKKVVGTPSGRPFTLALSCTLRTKDGKEIVLVDRRPYTFPEAGSRAVDDLGFPLPKGTRCWATEPDNGGATTSTVDHDTPEKAVTIGGLDSEPLTITATNTYETGTLRLAKKVVGTPSGRPFTLALTCTQRIEDGKEIVLVDRRPYTFAAAGSREVDDLGFPLPKGARCWATETDNGGATQSVVDHDTPEKAVTIGGKDSEPLTITATNTFKPKPPPPSPKARFTVSKQVVGSGPGPFAFRATCTAPGAQRPFLKVDFTLLPGRSRTFTVPEGSLCSARETSVPRGAKVTVRDSDPRTAGGATDGVVRAKGDVWVRVTNTFPPKPPKPKR